jgi:hypothetical protein
MPDLKPCPFCGAPAELTEHSPAEGYGSHFWGYVVACTGGDCGAQAGDAHDPWATAELATKAWNRRAPFAEGCTAPTDQRSQPEDSV